MQSVPVRGGFVGTNTGTVGTNTGTVGTYTGTVLCAGFEAENRHAGFTAGGDDGGKTTAPSCWIARP
jgi:hypothetical protein